MHKLKRDYKGKPFPKDLDKWLLGSSEEWLDGFRDELRKRIAMYALELIQEELDGGGFVFIPSEDGTQIDYTLIWGGDSDWIAHKGEYKLSDLIEGIQDQGNAEVAIKWAFTLRIAATEIERTFSLSHV